MILNHLQGVSTWSATWFLKIKLEGFRCKALLVAGVYMTNAPAVMTYASVVSRETTTLGLEFGEDQGKKKLSFGPCMVSRVQEPHLGIMLLIV